MLIMFQDLKMGHYECQSSSCAPVTSHSRSHSPCLRFFLPSLSPASFFFWHCSSLSVCFASIWTPLHLWDDGCVSSHTLTCQPSHLVLFAYLARALLTCTLNKKKKKKHRNTHSSSLCALCLMLSMFWRPSLYGRHPRGPHCICVTDNARKIQWGCTRTFTSCVQYIIHGYSLKSAKFANTKASRIAHIMWLFWAACFTLSTTAVIWAVVKEIDFKSEKALLTHILLRCQTSSAERLERTQSFNLSTSYPQQASDA